MTKRRALIDYNYKSSFKNLQIILSVSYFERQWYMVKHNKVL